MSLGEALDHVRVAFWAAASAAIIEVSAAASSPRIFIRALTLISQLPWSKLVSIKPSAIVLK